MTLPLRSRTWVTLSLAASMVAACNTKFAPPLSNAAPRVQEGKVSADAFGNLHLDLAGRSFVLKAVDGKVLGNLAIQVAGKYYATVNGAFALPGEALAALKDNSHGFFRVFAPGYVPRQVWIGQQGDEVPMVPLTPIKVVPAMFASGGNIAAPQAGLDVTIPAGILTKSSTAVELSTYKPTPPADVQAATDARNAFLDKLAKAKAGGKYRVAATGTCPAAEAPLPCPPAVAGMGVMLTINGPIAPGTVTTQLDLDVLARDPGQAAAAQRILQTFAQIDADPAVATIRGLLKSDYGLALSGHVLSFSVALGTQAAVDGFAKVEVQGVDLLGVNLEMTVVSSVGPNLPLGASTPGLAALPNAGGLGNALAARLIGNDGGSLISQDGGSLIGQDGASLIANDGSTLIGQDGASLIGQDGAGLISQDGGSLISNDGGGLISNDGGSLVGHVEVPFKPEGNNGKYALAAAGYVSYPYPGARVRAVTFAGIPLSAWVTTDANSNYAIQKLPPTPAYFWVEVQAGPYYLRTIAMATGSGRVIANVDAATTAVASAIYAGIVGNLADADFLAVDSFNDDVALEASWLTQTTAGAVVTAASIQLIDASTRALWQAKGADPESFDLHLPVAPPAAPAGPVPPALPALTITPMAGVTNPWGLAYDAGSKQLYVADEAANKILKYDLTGTPNLATLAPTAVGGAGWNGPAGLALGGGALFVADAGNHAVKRIKPAAGGTVTTLAGEPAVPALAVDGGKKGTAGSPAALRAHFGAPCGLAYEPSAQRLYVTDTATGQLRVLNLKKNPASAAYVDSPYNVAAPSILRGALLEPGSTNVLVADEGTNTVMRFNAAGAAQGAFSTGMSQPFGMAAAPNGDVFFAALGMPHVGKIPSGGGIPTVDYLLSIGGLPRAVVALSANEVIASIPGAPGKLVDIKF